MGLGAETTSFSTRPEVVEYESTSNIPTPDEEQGGTAATPVGAVQDPLQDIPLNQVVDDVDKFIKDNNVEVFQRTLRMGGLASKAQELPGGFDQVTELASDEKAALDHEEKHPWKSTPLRLYLLCALCAGCAIVQGMDQTVINGAQEFYFREFGITDPIMQGFLNGAPYCSAALIGCWCNAPLNRYLGRRGTIFVSCAIALVTALWQAASPNWPIFLAGRLILGIAVGAKSSTAPIYAAECAPKRIRGALTMMWQMWTAFGIMLGYIASIVFQNVDYMGKYSQWRWMIGVTAVPPMIVMAATYTLPESPRWHMDRGEYKAAYETMVKLRSHPVIAARDLYVAAKFVEAEKQTMANHNNPLKELFTVGRNLRAVQSAWFCMFMQQFCGVNIIAYYSTRIFLDAGFSRQVALWASFGCGALNWLGALPAVFTIDKFGRRKLLLTTLPVLSVCLFWTGSNFLIQDLELRIKLLMASIFIFMFVYSPGLGPVPFTYAAEAFPLHVRAHGMASATAVTWGLNFIISFTWPKMMVAMTPTGGFFWYATWNLVGLIFAYLLVPETKNRTLEELDAVFSVRNRDHACYQLKRLRRTGKIVCRQTVEPVAPLVVKEPADSTSLEQSSETLATDPK